MRMVDSEAGALEVSVTSVLLVWVLPVPAGWRSARQVWDVPGADHGEESCTAGYRRRRPSARWLVLRRRCGSIRKAVAYTLAAVALRGESQSVACLS